MPCDGVAVAKVKVALSEVVQDLERPEALGAVAELLRGQGRQVKVEGRALMVDRYVLRCSRGRVSGYAPAEVVGAVRQAFEQVAGVLAQERLAALIAQQAEVESRSWVEGYLVLQVNL